ncbi:MAG: LysM peptidoglycan-binding domain-containing protein [Epsilonproteobacteria bacterium]|nr:LysM peptidoglycan-binding domain-containing protein [Campylobacterota bacterium]
MIEVLSKKGLIVLMLTFSMTSMAEESIKLVDESGKSDLVQKEIVGCGENSRLEQQNRDLDEIKKQLAFILKKLSELETKKDTKQKSKDISNIKNCLSKLTKEKNVKENEEKKETKKKTPPKDHIVVVVKKGDRLSDYAKKYYGDKRKYYKIYRANRDKIAEDLQLIVGDRIIIPLSPHYKYKKFKKIKHIIKKKPVTPKKTIKEKPKEVKKTKESIEDYPMAKIFTMPKKTEVDMLEEPVFIDDEPVDNSDFIPLDDN